MIGNTKHALVVVLVAALSVGATALAASSTDAIKARQQAMKDIGDAMRNLSAIAKKEVPFDAGVVQKNAGTIAESLTKAADLFPEGSDRGEVETRAKPGIWSDRAGFEERLEAAQSAADALRSVGAESAFPPALGKLGDACKACHQTYRRPEN